MTLRLVFIGGYGRSGSTLLDRLLGEVDGVCSLGEVRHLWREGLAEDRKCGCGVAFSACPYWAAVMDGAFGPSGIDPDTVIGLQRQVDRWWKVPKLAVGPPSEALLAYADVLAALYRSAAAAAGAGVLVDSSKDVSHGYVLQHLPDDIDVRTVHLVRDPRASAYSWQRAKFNPGSGRIMDRWPPSRTAVEWSTINAITAASRHFRRPYLQLRYEDLTADPVGAVEQVLAFAGLPNERLPVSPDGTAWLHANHTVAGNPDRFRCGATQITADEAWRARLDRRSKLIVTAMAAPGLVRYGYPLWAPSRVDATPTRAGG